MVAAMVCFRGERLACETLDLIVDDDLIVEIEWTERQHPTGTLQLFNYLTATKLDVGLLLDFCREPKFHRIVCENRRKQRR